MRSSRSRTALPAQQAADMSHQLFAAIEAHDLQGLDELLAQGEDPNALHPSLGYYPLHAAIFELGSGGPIEVLDHLIRAGADVNRVDHRTEGTPPLLAAILDRQQEAARRLLIAGADPGLTSNLGDSPLRMAA